jgi:hypothetical protein
LKAIRNKIIPVVNPLTEFVDESFCSDARPMQFHSACQFLGTSRHLGLQRFAQRLLSWKKRGKLHLNQEL